MGLEKLMPVYGLIKSVRELKNIRDGDSIADGIGYNVRVFEVIGVSLLNGVYVAGVVAAVYSLING